LASAGALAILRRQKGIEPTRALAESPNSKIVIVGGRDGLPLILNTGPGGTSPGK
jgi:prohibitin 2